MEQFDLKKFLTENKLTSNSKGLSEIEDTNKNLEENNEFAGNPEVKKQIEQIDGMIDQLRGLGNQAYGGEKKNVYTSMAGEEFKAFEKAWSVLVGKLAMTDARMRL